MAKPTPKKIDSRMTLRFPEKFIETLKIEAIKRKTTATDLAMLAITKYLKSDKL